MRCVCWRRTRASARPRPPGPQLKAPMAWGRNNQLYMLTVGWDVRDTRSKVSIVLHRSSDLGDSWTSSMVRDARATEQDGVNENNRPVTEIVVDRKSGNDDIVYAAYRRGWSGTSSGNGRRSRRCRRRCPPRSGRASAIGRSGSSSRAST